MPSQQKRSELRIGIDIGGTFTDFVVYSPASGTLETFKLLSTPANPALAVLEGLERVLAYHPGLDALEIIHGSTVATNALLERKGAKTALVTTRGFRDVLQIGRQNRPELYNLAADPPPALVPAHLRLEVDERISAQGEILQPLDPQQVDQILPILKAQQVESVAVCLLFAYMRPEHETDIARHLRDAGYFLSASNEILPEYREYERFSTTAVNAYVSPVIDRYLGALEAGIGSLFSRQLHLRLMQSNGGSMQVAEARRFGVRSILSGPAGGIIGARWVAQVASALQAEGSEKPVKIITFDMGGTSTDVALIDGEPLITAEASVAGFPIRIPVLDIQIIGAGGGSIAAIDLAGGLRVGPESAGADPGPAGYGKGGPATVTDAHIFLGRIDPGYFLGGDMPLDPAASRSVIERLADGLSLDPYQAALGILQVANVHMERLLRLISVERGYDPRAYSLLSFGGAGGLHACELARRLGIRQVIVPPLAATLSAYGMLAAQAVKDYSQTVMLPGDSPPEDFERAFLPLEGAGLDAMRAEGISPEGITVERLADMRYQGQSYELTIPWTGSGFTERFHQAHERVYGYQRLDAPVEVVNLRIRVTGKVDPPELDDSEEHPTGEENVPVETLRVYLETGWQEVPAFYGSQLSTRMSIEGPALVLRPDTTVLVGAGDQLTVDRFGNLLIQVAIEIPGDDHDG